MYDAATKPILSHAPRNDLAEFALKASHEPYFPRIIHTEWGKRCSSAA
jgi:hypothetical protein